MPLPLRRRIKHQKRNALRPGPHVDAIRAYQETRLAAYLSQLSLDRSGREQSSPL
jgi:hypothetical protein